MAIPDSGAYASGDEGTVTISRLSDDFVVVSFTGPADKPDDKEGGLLVAPTRLLFRALEEFRHPHHPRAA